LIRDQTPDIELLPEIEIPVQIEGIGELEDKTKKKKK